jgi:hypothetical protein
MGFEKNQNLGSESAGYVIKRSMDLLYQGICPQIFEKIVHRYWLEFRGFYED